jgi:hypothetical protein
MQMTPNYFRIAQESYRAPKVSRTSSYIVWVLACRPGMNPAPKVSATGLLHSNQAKS